VRVAAEHSTHYNHSKAEEMLHNHYIHVNYLVQILNLQGSIINQITTLIQKLLTSNTSTLNQTLQKVSTFIRNKLHISKAYNFK